MNDGSGGTSGPNKGRMALTDREIWGEVVGNQVGGIIHEVCGNITCEYGAMRY